MRQHLLILTLKFDLFLALYLVCQISTFEDCCELPSCCLSLSGYPVLRSKIEFRRRERAASKEDWNKFVMSSKVGLFRFPLLCCYLFLRDLTGMTMCLGTE